MGWNCKAQSLETLQLLYTTEASEAIAIINALHSDTCVWGQKWRLILYSKKQKVLKIIVKQIFISYSNNMHKNKPKVIT